MLVPFESFEVVETGATLDKAAWDAKVPKLRTALLEAQYRVLQAERFAVVVVIGGVDGAGKGETVNLLSEWMDPRHIRAHAIGEPTDEELQRPPMWRFWRRLPPKGKIGVFFGSWYTQPIVARAMGESSKAELDAAMEEARRFETMLAREGVLVVKYWFHLSKKAQKKRLEELESSSKTRWRVTKEDWRRFERYDDFAKASARALRVTSTDDAPWTLVDGTDPRHRAVFVGEHLLAALTRKLEETNGKAKPPKAEAAGKKAKKKRVEPAAKTPIVRALDLTKRLDEDEYEEDLLKYQRKLALLTRAKGFAKLSPVLVFEGADAAGKGGAIRRITQALDARVYDVIPIAAPSDEERAQPYLWRFWRRAPRDGKLAMFDRSWFGRVVVERVEGFASEDDWRRAYDEINDFEAQLARAGCPIAKLWLQISPEEQLRRFQEREKTKWKRFKITPEDWRNREKAGEYEIAASEMIERTSTEHAPWTLVEADDKRWARVKVLKTVCDTIERAL